MGGCDGAGALTVLVGAVLEVEDRQLTEPIDERPDGLRQRGARAAVELGRLVRALRVREVHNPRAGGGGLAQRIRCSCTAECARYSACRPLHLPLPLGFAQRDGPCRDITVTPC